MEESSPLLTYVSCTDIKNASISHESSGILQLKPSDVAYDAVP